MCARIKFHKYLLYYIPYEYVSIILGIIRCYRNHVWCYTASTQWKIDMNKMSLKDFIPSLIKLKNQRKINVMNLKKDDFQFEYKELTIWKI